MRERVQFLLDHARAFVLLAAGAGVVFWLDGSSADVLGPKTFCFAAAAGLVAALTAARLWWGARLRLPPTRLLLALAALFIAVLFAFLHGSPRPRGESAFNAWLLILMLGLSALDWLSTETRRLALIFTLIALFATASAAAFAQYFGFQFNSMDAALAAAFGRRVSAGFGNPNFFGGFAVLCLPSTLWFAQRRALAWPLLLLGLGAVLMSGSKAAWLALGFQFFAWGHLIFNGSRSRERRRRFLKFWAAFGLASALLGLALLPAARARFVEALNPSQESYAFRLQTWRGSLSAFAASPLFGHGPGSFSAVYPAYRPQAAMASQVQHSYEVTHAENWVLQMLVEYGLVGLLALGWLFWLLLKPLWDAALKDEPLALALFLSLAGSLVCNLASLDLFLPSSFFFFALIAALAMATHGGQASSVGIKAENYAAMMLSCALIFVGLFPALQSLARWHAGRSLASARALSEAKQYDAALKAYDDCLLGDPMNTEAIYFKAATLLDSGKPSEALPVFAELQALAPDFVLVHDKKARADKALGKLNEAAFEWERQLELDPWFLPAVQELSGIYASQARLADAERVLAAAQAHFPGNADIAKNLDLVRQGRHARP